MPNAGKILSGMGGWSYKPWRETFYPPEVKVADELAYASRQVTAIEINSTFYGLQKPAVYAKWRAATPAGFRFSLKAPRFVVQRKVLGTAKDSIRKFIDSGIEELDDKLGPLMWQLAPSHVFDASDIEGFFELLPAKLAGRRLRHALNVRHESFKDAAFIELARAHGVAVVLEDDATHPAIPDVTADFVYARLRRTVSAEPTGYTRAALTRWRKRARIWAEGGQPADLEPVVANPAPKRARDVYIYFINGAKERAPAAAMALLEGLAAA